MTEQVEVFKVVLCVPDYDGLGREELVRQIENVRYPNRCIIAQTVESVDSRVIPDYDDSHPINGPGRSHAFAELFGREEDLRSRAEQTAALLKNTQKQHAKAADAIDAILNILQRGGFVE